MTKGRGHARILVLDADMIPALTIARSLARRKYIVDVASARLSPLASFSNTVTAHFRYPDPLKDERSFLQWLKSHQASFAYDLVIPVTERSLVPLSRHRAHFRHINIAMAEAESLEQVLDKAATFKLAERLDIPIPHSVYISDINQLEAASEGLTYPVVLKPSHSVSAGGEGYSKLNVRYAGNALQLYQQCEECLRHSPVILQSYFSGLGAGIELIAKEGRILYSFQHIRLHELPLTGGGSSFRTSTEVDPELLEAAAKLMSATHWTGVAMVEFKWNPDTRTYCLMEINGRFWGSLPLAAAAGADFPAMLADLLLTGEVGAFPDYRRGIYCRNLGNDIMWHEMVLRTKGDEVTKVPGIGSVLRDVGKLFYPSHRFDTQSLRDPLPGLVEIQRIATSYFKRIFDLSNETYFTLRQYLHWYNGTVREKLRAADSIMFICYGNINRSALAEILLISMLRSDFDKRVESAGFHREDQRPADHRMVKIAADRGYDLSRSSSSCITHELIENSDIIFVMEKTHYDQLLAMDSAAAHKVFLLGAHGNGPGNITDPYNKPESSYMSCFNQIDKAITQLASDLGTQHAG